MTDISGKLVFACDIGGTKTYLGLFEASGTSLKLVKKDKLRNDGYPNAIELIGSFLAGAEASGIAAASLGIASPVDDNRGVLTNRAWVVDGEDISREFGIDKVELINDLVATAWGVDMLTSEDLFVLKEGRVKQGNAALIGPGTGLGEALLYWDGANHLPIASEGGHTDFAPRGDVESELLAYLAARFGHVSYERILSGPGLENVYAFFRQRSGREAPDSLNKRFEAEESAAGVIADEALTGGDEVCTEALNLFVSVLGAEAGNLALKSLAMGGVYVGGGIAPKILPALKSGAFVESFHAKGRLSGTLERIPVNVILNDMTALFGAGRYAAALAAGEMSIKEIIRPGEPAMEKQG